MRLDTIGVVLLLMLLAVIGYGAATGKFWWAQ